MTVEPRHVLQCFGDESQDLSYSAAGERKKEGRKEKREREKEGGGHEEVLTVASSPA